METYKLGVKRLRSLGIEVSKLRNNLREAALQHDKGVAFVQGQDIHDVSRLAQRIRRGDYNDGALKKQLLRPDFSDMTAVGSRRYSRKRKPLSTEDKIDITHRVLVQFEKQADVAKQYRVSSQVVSSLVSRAKSDKSYLRELLNKHDEVDNARTSIEKTVVSLNESKAIIDSAKSIVDKVGGLAEAPVSEKLVRSVMKEELGMRYRKI